MVVVYIYQFFEMFAAINLGLAIFNILPIPPLDGFHLLNDTLLGGRLRMNAQFFQTSQLILILLVASGWLNGILTTIMSAVQNGVWNLFSLLTGVA